MKRCPKCGTTYTDETLRFCLADGTTLTSAGESEPTIVAENRDRMQVDIPTAQLPNFQTQETKRSSGPWVKIIAAILLLGFMGLVVVAVAGFLFYYSLGRKESSLETQSPTPLAVASPSPDTDTQKLEDELANLQKKLEEQTRSANSNTKPFPESDTDDSTVQKARVNSPNDGFLALRNLPSVEYGDIIVKIPHGASVEVTYCDQNRFTVAGRKGRWCLVTYDGNPGFVFDAFLIF